MGIIYKYVSNIDILVLFVEFSVDQKSLNLAQTELIRANNIIHYTDTEFKNKS